VAAPEAHISPDEAALNALEPYDPVYKLNSEGRVVGLRLEGRRIPASVLDEACKLTELTELSLYAASISDDDLEKLQSLKNLRGLGLGATAITNKGLAHLEKLPALRWIWLPKALVPSPGLEALKTAIPELTAYPQ